MPDGEDLRTLVNALETFLGFGDRLDGRDPEFFDKRRVDHPLDEIVENLLRALFRDRPMF